MTTFVLVTWAHEFGVAQPMVSCVLGCHQIHGLASAGPKTATDASATPAARSLLRRAGGSAVTAWREARAVLASREFLKFVAMCLFTINLKQIFRHVEATLPKYLTR